MSSTEGSDSTVPANELWRVQLATGEMRAMSLDALDDAFQDGLISENTPVLPPGATAWTKLGDAAGLDAAADEYPADVLVPSVAPLAVSIRDEAPASTLYELQRQAALDALDINTLSDSAFKPKKGRMFMTIGIAIMFVGGLGFAATRMGGIATSATNALTKQQKASNAAQPPPAAVDLDAASRRAAVLSEEQKKRLAEFDKANEAREAQKKKDHPPPPPVKARGPKAKTSQPFVNGGNKFDPLNGAL